MKARPRLPFPPLPDLAAELAQGSGVEQEFAAYLAEAAKESEIDRMSAEREKTGVFLHHLLIWPTH